MASFNRARRKAGQTLLALPLQNASKPCGGLTIPGVMTLRTRTLADVRSLLSHLPKDVRARTTSQGVAN
jgi:hypothetical protein